MKTVGRNAGSSDQSAGGNIIVQQLSGQEDDLCISRSQTDAAIYRNHHGLMTCQAAVQFAVGVVATKSMQRSNCPPSLIC